MIENAEKIINEIQYKVKNINIGLTEIPKGRERIRQK